MKDHISVTEDQIIQCKNDIVTHYLIAKLNNIILREGKTLGFKFTELAVGSLGEEVVLDKGYSAKKIEEIKNKYKQIQDKISETGNYIDFGDNVNVNLDKLYKVSKIINTDETYYRVHFIDGQVIELDYIDEDAKRLMKLGKYAKNNQNVAPDERQ